MSGFPYDPYLSDFDEMCQGARDPNKYFLAMNVSIASAKPGLSNPWSDSLDAINAFDLAEKAEASLGMINCVTVSSFCSPSSLVWGLDAAFQNQTEIGAFKVADSSGRQVPVLDGEFLITAAKELFGSGGGTRFNLAPGTICPVATRHYVGKGPGVMFSVCGLGIPEDRSSYPIIIMEDAGIARVGNDRVDRVRFGVTSSIARSVLVIGLNQGIKVSRVIIGFRGEYLVSGHVACGLVMAPYFSLARLAMPAGGLLELRGMTLEEWSKKAPFII